jgi:type VI secretion system secreted protein Hcp
LRHSVERRSRTDRRRLVVSRRRCGRQALARAMAVDYFLKLDGIPGESRDAKHRGQIELQSFSWGEVHHRLSAGSGAAATRVAVQDLLFVARVSKASPRIFLACAAGTRIPSAVLTACRSGRAAQDFLVYSLTEVIVSSYQTGGIESADGPVDQVSLSFGRLAVQYRARKANGSLEPPVSAGWDVKQNRQL